MDCEFHNTDLTNLKKPCKFLPQPKGRGPAMKNCRSFFSGVYLRLHSILDLRLHSILGRIKCLQPPDVGKDN